MWFNKFCLLSNVTFWYSPVDCLFFNFFYFKLNYIHIVLFYSKFLKAFLLRVFKQSSCVWFENIFSLLLLLTHPPKLKTDFILDNLLFRMNHCFIYTLLILWMLFCSCVHILLSFDGCKLHQIHLLHFFFTNST